MESRDGFAAGLAGATAGVAAAAAGLAAAAGAGVETGLAAEGVAAGVVAAFLAATLVAFLATGCGVLVAPAGVDEIVFFAFFFAAIIFKRVLVIGDKHPLVLRGR